MNKDWFEMEGLRKQSFDNKVWIPLWADFSEEEEKLGFEGYSEIYFGAYSVVISNDDKNKALEIEWMDIQVGDNRPHVSSDGQNYYPAGKFYDGEVEGYYLILGQNFEIERTNEIHLNQDIVLALELKREGDVWVCPKEDYTEVVKITRNSEGEPVKVEIRAEFLKDYLCATNSGLLLSTYQSRKANKISFPDIDWKDGYATEKQTNYSWEGRLKEIYEGDSWLDILGEVSVSRAWRTDTDFEEDIPEYDFPSDETSASESFTAKSKSRKISQASGEIWKNEWIESGDKSPRVRGDKVESSLVFIVDNKGTTETSKTLTAPSRWLWFHPDVINDLLKKRLSILNWYSEDTGGVGGARNRMVHFGVNQIGLINVYAKDIATVDEIDKKVWARHNVSPDGKVSAELLMSQMQTRPANTNAPEKIFFSVVNDIQTISKAKLGQGLFREHSFEKGIEKRIHRFQASTLDGFFLLCKEITRFLIERIDMDFLKILKKENGQLGTLKRLENILSALGYDGRSIMGILAGVYDLRLTDAHLPSKEKTEDALKLVNVDYEKMTFNSGKELIKNINNTLIQIREAFDKGDFTKL